MPTSRSEGVARQTRGRNHVARLFGGVGAAMITPITLGVITSR
ncbi:hypothetical protein WKI71_42950 [Streptomyces sp. MS1.AVA.1]|uniref:MFS transporter n=1 Tax=Streptomyces machairae TaxID=3134109 RepID=A0ABU8UUR5_9ACTN